MTDSFIRSNLLILYDELIKIGFRNIFIFDLETLVDFREASP